MTDDDYDRLLKISMAEFERKVTREVEELFEAARALPDEVCEIPFIGGTYSPHALREELVPLKQRVIRALCCQHWFEFEAPRWAQPLPLRQKDCWALYNLPNCRRTPVGQYSEALRSLGWHYRRAPPFEVFYSQLQAPPDP
jgi:hypothetical protein